MTEKKVLVVFTADYPFGSGESFVHNELNVLKDQFERIIVIPVSPGLPSDTVNWEINSSITVIDDLRNFHATVNKRLLLSHFFLIVSFIFYELRYNPNGSRIFGNFRDWLSNLLQCCEKAIVVSSILDKRSVDPANTVYYSFWLNHGAVILAVLKWKKLISSFVFKVHGYDVFEERRKQEFIPLKGACFYLASSVYTVATSTWQYVRAQFSAFKNKLKYFPLGVFNRGNNPFDKSSAVLVSCANLYPVKRVDLIVDALKYVTHDLHWYHIGAGPLLEEMISRSRSLPANIQVTFTGSMKNDDILKLYSEKPVTLFIHTSDSEGGIPVGIQEAISFGIPVVARNVGGVPDIVNDTTGHLLDFEKTAAEIGNCINDFITSEKNSLIFRSRVKQYWAANFDAEINFRRFGKAILDSGKMD